MPAQNRTASALGERNAQIVAVANELLSYVQGQVQSVSEKFKLPVVFGEKKETGMPPPGGVGYRIGVSLEGYLGYSKFEIVADGYNYNRPIEVGARLTCEKDIDGNNAYLHVREDRKSKLDFVNALDEVAGRIKELDSLCKMLDQSAEVGVHVTGDAAKFLRVYQLARGFPTQDEAVKSLIENVFVTDESIGKNPRRIEVWTCADGKPLEPLLYPRMANEFNRPTAL